MTRPLPFRLLNHPDSLAQRKPRLRILTASSFVIGKRHPPAPPSVSPLSSALTVASSSLYFPSGTGHSGAVDLALTKKTTTWRVGTRRFVK